MEQETKDQRLNKFVSKEIIHGCNHYAELLQGSDDFYDELENYYDFREIDSLKAEIEETVDDTERAKLEEELEDLEGRHDPQEVLEWYFVSEWLYGRLLEKGEVCYDSQDGYIWGRCCSGQSITLDQVIIDIADELYREVNN